MPRTFFHGYGQVIEERLGHLAAPRVVGAYEENVWHGSPPLRSHYCPYDGVKANSCGSVFTAPASDQRTEKAGWPSTVIDLIFSSDFLTMPSGNWA